LALFALRRSLALLLFEQVVGISQVSPVVMLCLVEAAWVLFLATFPSGPEATEPVMSVEEQEFSVTGRLRVLPLW